MKQLWWGVALIGVLLSIGIVSAILVVRQLNPVSTAEADPTRSELVIFLDALEQSFKDGEGELSDDGVRITAPIVERVDDNTLELRSQGADQDVIIEDLARGETTRVSRCVFRADEDLGEILVDMYEGTTLRPGGIKATFERIRNFPLRSPPIEDQ